jgi:membrane fusion protein, multidrug efflux system
MVASFTACGDAWRRQAILLWVSTIALLAAVLPIGAAAQTSAPIRGMVRALHQSSIASDLPVRVRRLLVREAQSFKKGDVLIEFDCERLEAELAAADATMREMQMVLDSNLYLDEKERLAVSTLKSRVLGPTRHRRKQTHCDRASSNAKSLLLMMAALLICPSTSTNFPSRGGRSLL